MSLLEITKKRIFEEMLRQVNPEGGWKAMVVDDEALRVLSSACRMYDVMEEQVTIIEQLKLSRQPLRKFECLYFMAPKETSIDLFLADWRDKPRYKAAHVFFLRKLPQELFSKISASKAAAYIKKLAELNLDYLVVERQVYLLEAPDTFSRLYSNPPTSSVVEAHIDELSSKLLTVCISLGEFPFVRYSRTHPISELLAARVWEKLEQYHRDTGLRAGGSRGRGTLLVVDRSLDLCAPLLHEYTYQAMLYDLLEHEVQHNQLKYTEAETVKDSSGREVVQNIEKTVSLNENDELWCKTRHMHMAVVGEFLQNGIRELSANDLRKKLSGNTSVRKLQEIIAATPQFTEQKSAYSMHLNLVCRLLDLNSAHDRLLENLTYLEQEMATGENERGDKASNLVAKMRPFLEDRNLSRNDKLRLLMLYVVTQSNLKEEVRNDLYDHAHLTREERAAIENLQQLGINLSGGGKLGKFKQKKKKAAGTEGPSYDVSRYINVLKEKGSALLSGELDPAEFPYVTSDMQREAEAASASKSKKKRRTTAKTPRWSEEGKGKGKEKESASPSMTADKPRLIIFVIGGMTYSEMRTAYELTEKFGVEVVIGSNAIFTPSNFLQAMQTLRR